MKRKRTRQRYSLEFKLEAVRLANQKGRKLGEVAKELSIGVGLLRGWRKQAAMREGMPAAEVFPGNGKQTRQDEEIRRLRHEVERLRQERDFLKKAAAYFAKEDPQ